ncbi:hypothetical protein T492DRAFT_1151278, partial [Pavlovales sp. CCMP2436]
MEPVKLLLAMGFPRDDVVNALLRTNNNLLAAVELVSSAAPELDRSGDRSAFSRGASSREDEQFVRTCRDEDLAHALHVQQQDSVNEAMARRAQREADYEELAIALQRQYSVNVPAPTAVPERAAPVPAAPAEHIVRPARVDDGTVKKQRQNSRKREAEKERKELLQETKSSREMLETSGSQEKASGVGKKRTTDTCGKRASMQLLAACAIAESTDSVSSGTVRDSTKSSSMMRIPVTRPMSVIFSSAALQEGVLGVLEDQRTKPALEFVVAPGIVRIDRLEVGRPEVLEEAERRRSFERQRRNIDERISAPMRMLLTIGMSEEAILLLDDHARVGGGALGGDALGGDALGGDARSGDALGGDALGGDGLSSTHADDASMAAASIAASMAAAADIDASAGALCGVEVPADVTDDVPAINMAAHHQLLECDDCALGGLHAPHAHSLSIDEFEPFVCPLSFE